MEKLYVFSMSRLLDYDEEDLIRMSDEEFKDTCKEEAGGRIFSLEDFQVVFNEGGIEPNIDIIRILKE